MEVKNVRVASPAKEMRLNQLDRKREELNFQVAFKLIQFFTLSLNESLLTIKVIISNSDVIYRLPGLPCNHRVTPFCRFTRVLFLVGPIQPSLPFRPSLLSVRTAAYISLSICVRKCCSCEYPALPHGDSFRLKLPSRHPFLYSLFRRTVAYSTHITPGKVGVVLHSGYTIIP